MTVHRNLAVLDLADLIADEINAVLRRNPTLLHADQLRRAAQSIAANIAEGFGRGVGAERAHFTRIARGSAEECIRHLQANQRAETIDAQTYWRLRNRLVTASRMLTALLAHSEMQLPAKMRRAR